MRKHVASWSPSTESGVFRCLEFASIRSLRYSTDTLRLAEWHRSQAQKAIDCEPTWRNGRRDRLRIYYRKVWRFESSRRHQNRRRTLWPVEGPWPSGKASALQAEDRRFESDRVHLSAVRHSCGKCIDRCGRSSAVERLLAKEKVVSSNLIARSRNRSAIRPTDFMQSPFSSAMRRWWGWQQPPAEIAQSVEHSTENAGVPSSSLGLGTSEWLMVNGSAGYCCHRQ